MAYKCERVAWVAERDSGGNYKFKIFLSFWLPDKTLASSDITKFFEDAFGGLDEDKTEAIESTMPQKIEISLDSGKYIVSLVDKKAWFGEAKKNYSQRIPIWRRATNGLRGLMGLVFNTN